MFDGPLHVYHMQPTIEFVSDFFQISGLGKSILRMQGDAGLLFGIDAGDDGVMPEVDGPLD